MPRRSKATLLDIVDYIVHLYHNEKKTIREIASILKAEGYDISSSSIHRTLRSYSETAKELFEIKEEVKALFEAVKENPATDSIEAIVNIVSARLLKFVKDIESFDFDDPHELVQAIHKLATSAEKLQRYREERLKKAMQELEKSQKETFNKEEVLKLLREVYEG
ncbi:MAG: phage protein Gp27 family protein [Desulfurococcaceae archaeon]